jgi:azurin
MKSAAILLIIFFAISCGSKKSEEGQTETGAAGITEIELTGNDQMQFNLKVIETNAGNKVKLTLKHIGQMAKELMGHNFILLKKDADMAAFATAAISAKTSEYIPAAHKNQIIAFTKLIGGGESTTIEFDAPSEPGTYKFLCSFPGHYMLMNGDFIVK